jgi:hypothetical protein
MMVIAALSKGRPFGPYPYRLKTLAFHNRDSV